MAHEVDATEEGIAAALFCPHSHVFGEIADRDGKPAGFAVWFYNFLTDRGRHGIYLDDVFVRPENRGHGIGGGLLRHLAQRYTREGLPGLE